MTRQTKQIEWPTIALIAACMGTWMVSTWLVGRQGQWPFLALAALCVTLQSSLQHEVLHGHPTRMRLVNEALVGVAIGLFIPYRRFKALHLQHHNDANLTDPYEDPETNYMAKADWDRLPAPAQWLRQVNNTMVGRLILGPAVAVIGFWLADARRLLAGDGRVALAWALHAVSVSLALGWVLAVCHIGIWTYVFAVAYPAFSLLTLRTFLEHRAEQAVPERTCIVEDDSGFWGLLFLNNNLHVVHHMEPTVPWYRLPVLYAAGREQYRSRNGGYCFPSYWAIVRTYAFRSKEPVPHPFLRRQP